MIYPVSRNVKSHSSAFDYAWLLVYYIQAQLTLPYLPCLPINVFAQWKPVCLKIETNIANVSVVNLVKYISDKLKARFLFKMQPKFTADEKVKQSRIWWKMIDYHKDLLGSVLPRAAAVRGQDLEIQEGKRKLFLLCSLSGTFFIELIIESIKYSKYNFNRRDGTRTGTSGSGKQELWNRFLKSSAAMIINHIQP